MSNMAYNTYYILNFYFKTFALMHTLQVQKIVNELLLKAATTIRFKRNIPVALTNFKLELKKKIF